MIRFKCCVNDRLVLWHRDAEICLREAAPDAKNHIRAVKEMPNCLWHCEATRPQGKLVVFGKSAFPANAGCYRRRQKFREPPQLLPSAGPMNTLPRVDDTALGIGEHPRRIAHSLRFRTKPCYIDRCVRQRARQFFIPEISRDLNQNRTSTAVAQAREGAAHYIWYLGGNNNRLGRFRDTAHLCDRIVIRLDMRESARITSRHDQDWNGFCKGLRNTSIRIFSARPVLHAER